MRSKGVLRELDRVQEPAGIHLAQAKCYASMVAEQEGADEIGVQMTYCQMETEEVKRFQYSYQSNELKVWFDEVIRQYKKWAKFQIEWRKARNASIKGIEFPFPYRKGQRACGICLPDDSSEEKSCSSRHQPEWGRRFQRYFRQ